MRFEQHVEEAGRNYDDQLNSLQMILYTMQSKQFYDMKLSSAGRVDKEDILELVVPETFRILNTPPSEESIANLDLD